MVFKVPPKSSVQGETYNLTTDPAHFMKLHPDKLDTFAITAYGPGWISINGEKVTQSTVITSRGERFEWNCQQFDELTPIHFERLAELGAEMVLFGSGRRLRFPQPAWLASLVAHQTGVETMDTEAACRTYNILAAEGRHVVLAMVLEQP
jgi:uncharacterized protein